MLHYFKAFSVFLIWAFIALTAHFFIHSHFFEQENFKKNTFTSKNNIIPKYFVIDSKKDTLYTLNTPFKIIKNSSEILNLNDFSTLFDSINTYLNNHYKKELIITGLYSKNEQDSLYSENLGLLRANKVKSYFKKFALANYQLKSFSEVQDNLFENNNKKSGVTLKIKNVSDKTLDSVQYKISNKRIYVDFKADKIIPNKSIKNYTALLIQYIKEYPNKTIYITGHTDNKGYYRNNLIIGLNRANLVKNYFKQNGMEHAKIVTSSKGESEPIADKNTKEGKAKNRRIEIKIN